MAHYVWDIEGNGLHEITLDQKGQPTPECSKVHCLVAIDVQTKEMHTFRPHQINEGWDLMCSADSIIGHNIMQYDIPVMERITGRRLPDSVKIIDTFTMAQLMWPDRSNNPVGGYGLKQLGIYFGENEKADYSGGWEEFNEEMLSYCQQDVRANLDIFRRMAPMVKDRVPKHVLQLEHDFARIISDQTATGWHYDIDGGERLLIDILMKKRGIEDDLRKAFPDIKEEMKSPQYWEDPETGHQYTTKGDIKGKGSGAIRERVVRGPNKFKMIPFNPGSSVQLASRLNEKYGWQAEVNEASGKPICDVEVLQSLDFPEAKLLLEYRDTDKLRGQVEDWNARAGYSRDGRIHGTLKTLGTVTGRTAATQPNVQQVSGDKAARSLWQPTPGWVQVGSDLSGLELRCLAHYMAPFDDGAYADLILNGDIHTANQNAAGLETRDQAKTFIYALIYGGGNAKIGSIVGGSASKGGRLKDTFYQNIPALKKVIDQAVACADSAGEIKLLDDRVVPVRSAHKALNVLLQGAGAVISKVWCITANRRVAEAGLRARQIGFIHDEMQWECHPADADQLCEILTSSSVIAGEELGIRMPVDSEAQIGANWSECH